LDVEAFAVFVRPGGTDAGPEAFSIFRLADMESDMSWSFGTSGLLVAVVGLFAKLRAAPLRPDGKANKGPVAGALAIRSS
jgi:hypothetical protein